VVPIKYLKVLAAIAAIVLIMFLPVRNLIEKTNPPAFISELSTGTEEKEELTPDKPNPLTAPIEEAEAVQKTVNEIPPADISNKELPSSLSGNELVSINSFKENEAAILSKGKLALHSIKDLLPDTDTDIILTIKDVMFSKSIETEVNNISEPIESSGISFRVAEVGLVYGYKNTWLLNHETINGLNPKKLGNTLPTFHQDIGVSSSFELNNRHMFGLEFLWKSETGQNYQQYINASFVDRNIKLDYIKLQAFYFRENNKLPGQAIVGGYFARLKMAEEQQSITRFNVKDSYSDIDYGLLAGYQLSFALKNKIIFNPGIRVSYDLGNIFKGDDIIPGQFKKTRNLAASFNLSLSYRFSK
jgi:hypothetical protein